MMFFWRTSKTIYLALLICITLSCELLAGGSFRLDGELMPILDESPVFKKLVFDTFDLHWTGGASRIGVNVNDRLGGRRIGPYYLNAKPKGQEGDFTLTLIFHTEVVFMDKDGKKTTLRKAYSIDEELHSIEMIPIGSFSAKYLEMNQNN